MDPSGFSGELELISSEEIFECYHERIYRYILRLVPQPTEAEDLTQETFLRVYRQLASLRSHAALISWLYRIATHICYDRFRQSSFRVETQSLDEDHKDRSNPLEENLENLEEPKLDQVIDQDEMSACVQRYIGRLSDDYRTAILLHDLHGMTCLEISRVLSCSLEAVKIRLSRARQKLRVILSAGCNFSYNEGGAFACEPKLTNH